MKRYNKKSISKDEVYSIHKKYGIELLEASIFARRGLTHGKDIMYYLESDMRFTHQPFLFSTMEDVVSRINDAIEEGEKVLIFGDKDVDGVTSTAILYGYLKKQGLDVQWRLPVGDDAYGLSIEAIDDFIKSTDGYGSLIITVDCGISNVKEVAYAREKGLDVIITDHHNPPKELPNATIIIDPKLPDSEYPFKDISGAAVAYKIVSALRFSKFDIYNQDICLLNVQENTNETYTVQALKVRNLVKKDLFTADFSKEGTSIYDTKLPDFLSGQQIFVWNEKKVKSMLSEIFSSSIDFQVFDLEGEISKMIPSVKGKDLALLKKSSRIARYEEQDLSQIDSFFNIFVTFVEKSQINYSKSMLSDSLKDLQLVGIAALADIMPMQNENRIFVKKALEEINEGRARHGIAELLARMEGSEKKITSTDLSWKLIPALNASGRMGQSNISLSLLIEENPIERNKLADKIIELNNQRKIYVSEGELYTANQAKESFEKFNQKLCIVIDERINRGVTGILAAKIMQKYNVPSIAITFSEDKKIAVGSMRSCRKFVATTFLDSFGSLFINHGGHDAAAGFSFESSKVNEFLDMALKLSENINLNDSDDYIEVDAELPEDYITPEVLKTVDKFEPFGESNKELVFMSKSLKIQDAIIVGKSERQHLKLIFDCGKYKFPAMYWGEAERLNRDFKTGDRLNLLYNLGKNNFNGNTTAQMILLDAENSNTI